MNSRSKTPRILAALRQAGDRRAQFLGGAEVLEQVGLGLFVQNTRSV
jgi:hypothetical protein